MGEGGVVAEVGGGRPLSVVVDVDWSVDVVDFSDGDGDGLRILPFPFPLPFGSLLSFSDPPLADATAALSPAADGFSTVRIISYTIHGSLSLSRMFPNMVFPKISVTNSRSTSLSKSSDGSDKANIPCASSRR